MAATKFSSTKRSPASGEPEDISVWTQGKSMFLAERESWFAVIREDARRASPGG